ncbi:caspase domain-containing protein [Roridomyces roridus]|uniref:Caspase domain-containing protein n=1 Tax=Roridomyces roridus TaxID=1738132 RepID=A0AAD7FMY1_9AGAR|nr:caspase domain-containing protein [Roridomyces roridus]
MDPVVRVFALIVGIDQYRSGEIWNLQSCVDDAKKVKRWLLKDLKVSKSHVCVLLDKHATKENIEKNFLRHLVHNENIQRGDAIVVYFAGHGSAVPAPGGWFQKGSVSGTAEVLCTYDFGSHGVAGISDRSLQSMLGELSDVKGDNITVILDACFSPPANIRDRRHTRWTPHEKLVSPQDLLSGLWPAARTRTYPRGVGFRNNGSKAYTLLAACSPGEKAVEGKDGGKFTSAFIETARETPLHSASYSSLLRDMRPKIGEGQRPVAAGANVKRPVFDAVPFHPDEKTYYQTDTVQDPKMLRIGLGAVHGVVEGTEFSVHAHNYRGSVNPAIAHVSVTDVFPTWSFGYMSQSVPSAGCWAQIKRWNNRGSLSMRTKRSLSILRRSPSASLRSVSLFNRWKG